MTPSVNCRPLIQADTKTPLQHNNSFIHLSSLCVHSELQYITGQSVRQAANTFRPLQNFSALWSQYTFTQLSHSVNNKMCTLHWESYLAESPLDQDMKENIINMA